MENKTIREIVIDKRKKVNMTQVELAEKASITQAQISNFESGKATLGSDKLDKIFDVLRLKSSQTKEEQWTLSGDCALIIKEKKLDITNMSKEELAHVSGNNEILLLQNIPDDLYEKYVASKIIDEHNTFNYFMSLVKFRLACLK
jgi:Predicted transcriptional regulator with C-terminal CBS domains